MGQGLCTFHFKQREILQSHIFKDVTFMGYFRGCTKDCMSHTGIIRYNNKLLIQYMIHGHKNPKCCQAVNDYFLPKIITELKTSINKKFIIQSFLDFDKELYRKNIPGGAGITFIILYKSKSNVFNRGIVCYLGDSPFCFLSQNGDILSNMTLENSHTTKNLDEIKRIKSEGGTINESVKKSRYLPTVNTIDGQTIITRSFGYFNQKNGISVKPSFQKFIIPEGQKIIGALFSNFPESEELINIDDHKILAIVKCSNISNFIPNITGLSKKEIKEYIRDSIDSNFENCIFEESYLCKSLSVNYMIL
jgi:hypothetical protein